MRDYRAEWIAALESGRFRQAFGTVRDGEKLCTMGVGIEVLREQSVALPDGWLELVKQHFWDHLGITARQFNLVNKMNDRLYMSHAEIARILRQFDHRDALISAEHDPAVWDERVPRERLVGEDFPRD
jgi:hypothetical protein